MTAIVFVSATEADLVRQGRLEEPGYRPRATSTGWFFGDPDEDENPDEDETYADEEPDSGGGDKFDPVDSLQQSAMARHWKRHSYDQALLLAPSGVAGGWIIIGVSVAAGGPRIGLGNGVRRLMIGPWVTFGEYLSTNELVANLPGRAIPVMTRILGDGHSRPLPDALSASVNGFLRTRIINYDQLLSSLPDQPAPIRQRIERPAVADANVTALRLFSPNWRALKPVPSGPPSEFSANIELAARGNENDYITDDSTYFLDWDRSNMSRLGWWEFRKGNKRLHLKNINVSTAENTTGADLVYVSREPDTVVLVQYKLLEPLERTKEPIFRPDGRLANQIGRMLGFCPNTAERGSSEELARVGGDFGFVKFIRPEEGDTSILERPTGRYYPADAVRRMLANPDVGPNGGVVHYVYNRRYIDGGTFAKLVRDRWIGSTGSATELLLGTLGVRSAEESQPITLAVEETLQVSGDNMP